MAISSAFQPPELEEDKFFNKRPQPFSLFKRVKVVGPPERLINGLSWCDSNVRAEKIQGPALSMEAF